MSCEHLLARLACLAALLGVLSAGAAEERPTPPTAAIPITVWTHSAEVTAEFQALQAAAEAFNRSQAEYHAVVFPSIYRNYEDRVQSGAATGNLPCLLELDGPFLYAFAWPGYLRPIERLMPREMLADFLPSVLAQGTYDGHLYSLGQYDSGLALWGNRRHLAAAGVRIPTLESPWSLAEFEEALQRLATTGGVDYPLSLNVHVKTPEFYSYAYAPILQGFGGDLIERDTYAAAHGVLDGPESVAAMKRFQDWFARGWTQAVFDRADDFEKGRTSLSWTGHWKYPSYKKALGEDLVLMPLPDFGRGIKTGMGSWAWAISSTCRNPAGAARFLQHLLSPQEIQRMTDTNGAVPARRAALARSSLYGPEGPVKLFARQLEAGAGVPRPATPGYRIIRDAFADAVSAIIAGADVQTELSRAAAAIDGDIARHRRYPHP